MILAHNLNTAMKRLVLGEDWATKRMKALRFRLIGLPGRVVRHARKLIIRLGAGPEALETIVNARAAIRALACGPAGSTAAAGHSASWGQPPATVSGGNAPPCPALRLREPRRLHSLKTELAHRAAAHKTEAISMPH